MADNDRNQGGANRDQDQNQQGQHVRQGEGAQGLGSTTDQLGEKKQTYGASTRQDATGGQGPQHVTLDARGGTGHLGAAPAQSEGQPASTTTGGPKLSEGLRDQNSRGDT